MENHKANAAEQPLAARTESSAPAFLRKAAGYFRGRLTNGEDLAHWSNVYNAENCERIATEYEAMLAALKILAEIPFEAFDRNESAPDDKPLMGWNEHKIRIGHVRDARAAIAKATGAA